MRIATKTHEMDKAAAAMKPYFGFFDASPLPQGRADQEANARGQQF
jgi:hypothetical protein